MLKERARRERSVERRGRSEKRSCRNLSRKGQEKNHRRMNLHMRKEYPLVFPCNELGQRQDHIAYA